jgi:heme O synthase-like polyprenyltransferase
LSTISGTGWGQSIPIADAQAAANLAAERARVTGMARTLRRPIKFGSITQSRTVIRGWGPWGKSQNQTIMTQTYYYSF